MSGSCAFKCGICKPGERHVCNNCHAINDHLSKNCPTVPCIFDCGFCERGDPHVCRTCRAINDHRTANCTLRTEMGMAENRVSRSVITQSRNDSVPKINYHKNDKNRTHGNVTASKPDSGKYLTNSIPPDDDPPPPKRRSSRISCAASVDVDAACENEVLIKAKCANETCNVKIIPDAQYCHICGTKQVIHCKNINCYKPLPHQAVFCPYCGTKA